MNATDDNHEHIPASLATVERLLREEMDRHWETRGKGIVVRDAGRHAIAIMGVWPEQYVDRVTLTRLQGSVAASVQFWRECIQTRNAQGKEWWRPEIAGAWVADERPPGTARTMADMEDRAARSVEVSLSGPACEPGQARAIREALGTVRVGPPKPDGCEFKGPDQHGDVWVEVVDKYYWAEDTDAYLKNQNADAKRWPPHAEPARQYAAWLIGETAPPIDPKTAEPGDPRVEQRPFKVGDRVRLLAWLVEAAP